MAEVKLGSGDRQLAFQKNMPLEEAIAPEARDQAFGRNNNIEEKESKKGIFSHSQSEMIINRRLSNREITDKQGIARLDKMVGNCFADDDFAPIEDGGAEDGTLTEEKIGEALCGVNCKERWRDRLPIAFY